MCVHIYVRNHAAGRHTLYNVIRIHVCTVTEPIRDLDIPA